MKRSFLLISIAFAALFILSACSPGKSNKTAPIVEVTPSGVVAEGKVMPASTMEQSFSIAGQVEEVLVKSGESVKKGQVLARLTENKENVTALARAQQELINAQKALDDLVAAGNLNLAQSKLAVIAAEEELNKMQSRYDFSKTDENQYHLDEAAAKYIMAVDAANRLALGTGVDANDLAAANARLATAQASINSAQAAVANRDLLATQDGTVLDVDLPIGTKVTANQPVMMLADLSRWVVRTDNLAEIDIVNVHMGQKVNITLDAVPSATLTGKVSRIDMISTESRGDVTYTVTADLTQIDPLMRWGMTAAVEFVP